MSGPFGTAAVEYQRLGLAVIPLNGKRPAVRFKQFLTKQGGPPLGLTEKWATGPHASANVGVLCGRPSGVTVIDVDAADQIDTARERFGETPLEVSTPSGGRHLWFTFNGERSSNLRRHGLAVDVKSQGGYVAAPPSIGKQGNYRWQNGGIELLRQLPTVLPGAFDFGTKISSVIGSIPEGQRNDRMIEFVRREAFKCQTVEELIDRTRVFNERCDPHLPDEDVIAKAAWAMQRKAEGCLFANCERGIIVRESRLMRLIDDPYAQILLEFLMLHNAGWRPRFWISPDGLEASLHWNPKTIARARDRLIKEGFVRRVEAARRNRRALYEFTEFRK